MKNEIVSEIQKLQKDLKNAYYRLFNTEDGRKVLADLTKTCGYNTSSVCVQSPDPYQTFFAEGKRYVILHILNKLERKAND